MTRPRIPQKDALLYCHKHDRSYLLKDGCFECRREAGEVNAVTAALREDLCS